MSTNYPLTRESLLLILSVTKIDSEKMQNALHDHLVLDHKQSEAASRYGVSRQQLWTHVHNVQTDLKPTFDAYVDLVKNNL